MPEYIERETAIKAAQYAWVKDLGHGPTEYIEDIPAADVEPVRHGRFGVKAWLDARWTMQCSICGADYDWEMFRMDGPINYCPNCGAKMDLE